MTCAFAILSTSAAVLLFTTVGVGAGSPLTALPRMADKSRILHEEHGQVRRIVSQGGLRSPLSHCAGQISRQLLWLRLSQELSHSVWSRRVVRGVGVAELQGTGDESLWCLSAKKHMSLVSIYVRENYQLIGPRWAGSCFCSSNGMRIRDP